MFTSRKDLVFYILAGFFISNALLGEMIGGKLIEVRSFLGMGPWTLSIGILPWPIVFLLTDLTNEYFGRKGVRQLTLLTSVLIAYAFVVVSVCIPLMGSSISPVPDDAFQVVFGTSRAIMVGSLVAFMISQLIDVSVFWFFRDITGSRYIWLRATGSTVIAQAFDTFIVQGIGFYLPGKLSFQEFIAVAWSGYTAKLLIAIALTPLVYLGHFLINRYLSGDKKVLD
jgi:uncharacterized integral membrane protein (TIGR00697 family)